MDRCAHHLAGPSAGEHLKRGLRWPAAPPLGSYTYTSCQACSAAGAQGIRLEAAICAGLNLLSTRHFTPGLQQHTSRVYPDLLQTPQGAHREAALCANISMTQQRLT